MTIPQDERRSYLRFAIAMVAILLAIRFLLDFNGLYGQDSHEYFRYAQRWREFLLGGAHPGDYFWPINYALYSALISLLLPFGSLPMQLLSILTFALLCLYTVRLIFYFYPTANRRLVFTYVTLFLFLSPFLFQSSLLVMSDISAAFFTLAAVYHMLQYRERARFRDFALTVFFSASAVMTRYLTGPVLLLPLLFFADSFRRNFRWAHLLAGVGIAAICCFPHFFIRGAASGEFLAHNWLINWHPRHWFMRSFTTIEGQASYLMANFFYGFSNFFYPGFLFSGIVFLVFFRPPKNRLLILLLLIPLFLYGLLLSGIPIQNMRYLLLTFPFVIILLFPAAERIASYIPAAARLLLIAAVVLIQAFLIQKYSTHIYRANQVEKQVAEALHNFNEPVIYTFAIDGALRSYGIENEIINLWDQPLDSAEIGALLLFAPEKFQRQWQDENPMVNWRFFQENYALEVLEDLPDGWRLYRIGGIE